MPGANSNETPWLDVPHHPIHSCLSIQMFWLDAHLHIKIQWMPGATTNQYSVVNIPLAALTFPWPFHGTKFSLNQPKRWCHFIFNSTLVQNRTYDNLVGRQGTGKAKSTVHVDYTKNSTWKFNYSFKPNFNVCGLYLFFGTFCIYRLWVTRNITNLCWGIKCGE